MRPTRIAGIACAIALAASQTLGAAPLFTRADGSLSASLPPAARSASVQIDRGTLQSAQPGSDITIEVPGVGRYSYRILQRVQDGEVTRLDGVLAGETAHRLTLGVRADGVAGMISTPAGLFTLGYVNGRQWLGAAGAEVQAAGVQESPQPRVLHARTPTKDEQPPVPGAQPVQVNLASLTDMREGDEAMLPLPGVGALRVSYDTTSANASSASWIGHLTDFGTDFRVILTYSPSGTLGHILTPQGEFEVQTSNAGGAYLVDPAKLGLQPLLGPAACATGQVGAPQPGGAASSPGAHTPLPAAAGSSAGGHAAGMQATTVRNDTATTSSAAAQPQVAAAGAVAASVVDVLVLYSPGFAADKGSTTAVQTAIDHSIALANQAYVDSGVALRLRKVGTLQVNVPDTSTNTSALYDLTNGAGAFSSVKSLRDRLGADLVTLVRPFRYQYQAGCGVGWVGGYGGTPIANASGYAYSVVSDGRDRGGSNWYCDVTAFAHELGHNMGLMHDRGTVAQEGSGIGATPYAYGYGINGTFGTVMSYLWPKLGKFSNPNDYTCAGSYRCGIPETDTARSADNAKALEYTRAGVAAFRATSVPTAVTITGVTTVNGVATAGVSVTGAACTVSAANGVYQCRVSPPFSGVLTPSYVLNGRATTFNPSSRSFGSLSTSVAGQNFAGTR